MRYIILIGLLLVFCEAKAATTVFQTLQPLVQQDDFNNYSGLLPQSQNQIMHSYPDISNIENSLYGRTFEMQNISTRLSRIEKTLFTTTYPSANNLQRIDNIISNFNQINKYPNISRNILSRMENKVFSQTFQQNTPERRVERLEQQVFGAVQSGDVQTRYENLLTAVKDYSNINQNSTDSYNPANIANGGWKGLVGMLGSSLLGGSMTGFTPPITPYGNSYGYNTPYMNNGMNSMNTYGNIFPQRPQGSGIYKGYRSNTGYYDSYNDFGTGTGVTILD